MEMREPLGTKRGRIRKAGTQEWEPSALSRQVAGRLPGTLSNKGSTTPTIDYLVLYLDDLVGRGRLRRRSKWITWHSVSRGGMSPSRLPGTLWGRRLGRLPTPRLAVTVYPARREFSCPPTDGKRRHSPRGDPPEQITWYSMSYPKE
jgi:hypothetical protein